MIKSIVTTLTGVIAGVFLAYAWFAVSALFAAFILGMVLDPFLALINVPFLTERFGGIGFGQLFILVFTLQLMSRIAAKPNIKTGTGE
jgi:hypothetical protein